MTLHFLASCNCGVSADAVQWLRPLRSRSCISGLCSYCSAPCYDIVHRRLELTWCDLVNVQILRNYDILVQECTVSRCSAGELNFWWGWLSSVATVWLGHWVVTMTHSHARHVELNWIQICVAACLNLKSCWAQQCCMMLSAAFI